MSNSTLTELEHRLALAEVALQDARAQVHDLQERARPQSSRGRMGTLGLLGLVLVFALTRILVPEAQGARPEVLTVRAPFTVMDASGTKVLLKMAEFSTGVSLTIGDVASGGVTIGVVPGGSGVVNVRTAAGKYGVSLREYKSAGMGVHVFAPDGETVEGSLTLDPAHKGLLSIGDVRSGGTEVGVGKSGGGYVSVRRNDGKPGVELGHNQGRPMSVDVFGDKGTELVSLRTDEKGGRVQVWTPAGAPVAGLFAADTGGGLALTGPAGGKSAVSLSVASTGGKVRVFPEAGGSAQAELTAESSGGAVTVYHAQGTPAASMNSANSRGYLELNDSTGKKMVEASSQADGRGYVLVTPWQVSMETQGDPSVLRGGKSKK